MKRTTLTQLQAFNMMTLMTAQRPAWEALGLGELQEALTKEGFTTRANNLSRIRQNLGWKPLRVPKAAPNEPADLFQQLQQLRDELADLKRQLGVA